MVEIGQAVRQGDILLVRVAELPKGVRRKDISAGQRIVVEYGEATGHAHTLDPQTVVAYDILSDAGSIVGQAFRVLEPTPLTHQEHGAIELDPAIWERWYQVEDDGDRERQVAD